MKTGTFILLTNLGLLLFTSVMAGELDVDFDNDPDLQVVELMPESMPAGPENEELITLFATQALQGEDGGSTSQIETGVPCPDVADAFNALDPGEQDRIRALSYAITANNRNSGAQADDLAQATAAIARACPGLRKPQGEEDWDFIQRKFNELILIADNRGVEVHRGRYTAIMRNYERIVRDIFESLKVKEDSSRGAEDRSILKDWFYKKDNPWECLTRSSLNSQRDALTSDIATYEEELRQVDQINSGNLYPNVAQKIYDLAGDNPLLGHCTSYIRSMLMSGGRYKAYPNYRKVDAKIRECMIMNNNIGTTVAGTNMTVQKNLLNQVRCQYLTHLRDYKRDNPPSYTNSPTSKLTANVEGRFCGSQKICRQYDECVDESSRSVSECQQYDNCSRRGSDDISCQTLGQAISSACP